MYLTTKNGANSGSSDEVLEEEQWSEHTDNPLLNDVILTKLFEQVRRDDLKACRLICKKWNVLTIPCIRSKFKITIYGDNLKPQWSMRNFVQLFKKNVLGIPFSKFTLVCFSTTATDGVGQQFLELCGETTKEVELLSVPVHTVEDVCELLNSMPGLEYFQCPYRLNSRQGNVVKLSLPRLKTLKKLVLHNNIVESTTANCHPTFAEQLITAAENTEDIAISEMTVRCSLTVWDIIEKLGRESSIQGLYLSRVTEDLLETLERLKPKGLKLRRLICSQQSENGLTFQLITLFKDTLQFFNVLESWTSFVELQKMSNLESMVMRISSQDINLIAQNLGLLQLREFNCIRNNFPRLAKLDLSIRTKVDGVQILRKIWTQMTQLESLKICGRLQTQENLDSLVTGIPAQILERTDIERIVLHELGEMTKELRKETVERIRNEHCQLPSIGNLAKLRSVSISLSGEGDGEIRDRNYLTDLSGYFGLYSLKNLKHIRVMSCVLTTPCCEILRDDLGLESWEFHAADQYQIIIRKEISV